MKRLVVLLCLVLAFGCNRGGDNTGSKSESSAAMQSGSMDHEHDAATKQYVVGISKFIAHPALDAVEQGIIDELKELGIDAKYDLQSAKGEITTARSIASKYNSERVDVAVGIATPIAQALANALKDIPVVFSAVTDPIGAGLRTSNDAEDSNVAGVSDMTPVEEQIVLMNKIKPIKTLGHVYNASEANSIELLRILTEVCNKMGIKLIATTVANTSEVRQATEFLAGQKVDSIYVSTDNIVVAALQSLTAVADRASIPVVSADPSSAVDTGVLVAYGVDYYTAGRNTGKIVARILQGEKAGSIPVKYMVAEDELGLYFNETLGEKLGLKLPE
jgi:putative ABC transport system substrate-binding protein